MTKKRILVALDDGHGMETAGKRSPFIGEIGRAIKENEFNRAVVSLLAEELKRCGFDVLLVAPTDADTTLATRVKRANDAKADIYISIHYDAFDGKFDGYDPEGITVFYATGSANGKRLAQCINDFLKLGTIQKNRGIKTANYYVLKETDMPAILSENGFMDNKREALLMIDPNFQREVAIEHAKGICKYFGVPYVQKAPTKPTTTKPHRVKTGAFNTADAAKQAQMLMDRYNIASSKWSRVVKDGSVWRVLTGTYASKDAAEAAIKRMQEKGILKIAYAVE